MNFWLKIIETCCKNMLCMDLHDSGLFGLEVGISKPSGLNDGLKLVSC